jgi:multisubunit Na+/H+ antiporter MnhF subunit
MKISDKLLSRKFHVFLVWIVLIIFCIFNKTLTDTIIQYFGLISLAYIGSNSFQKYLEKK